VLLLSSSSGDDGGLKKFGNKLEVPGTLGGAVELS
jgi:hypothetical protein